MERLERRRMVSDNLERRSESKWPEQKEELDKKEERPIRTRTDYGRELIKNLQLKKGEVFVDVGCGIGLQTTMAAQEGVKKAVGIDLNKATVEFAKKLARLTELFFLDEETRENFIFFSEKMKERWKEREKFVQKVKEILLEIRKKETSLTEKEDFKRQILDLMPHYIFDFYKFYNLLKSEDPRLDEKLEKIELSENLNFLNADAAHLPLKSNSADKILSVDVINWIREEDKGKFLQEILRIAKNGALLEVFPPLFLSNLRKLAEKMNIKIEKIGEKEIGILLKDRAPIYKVIKPEKK